MLFEGELFISFLFHFYFYFYFYFVFLMFLLPELFFFRKKQQEEQHFSDKQQQQEVCTHLYIIYIVLMCRYMYVRERKEIIKLYHPLFLSSYLSLP